MCLCVLFSKFWVVNSHIVLIQIHLILSLFWKKCFLKCCVNCSQLFQAFNQLKKLLFKVWWLQQIFHLTTPFFTLGNADISTGRKVLPKVSISNTFFIVAHLVRFIYLYLKVFRKVLPIYFKQHFIKCGPDCEYFKECF